VWATVERTTGALVGRCGSAVWDVEGHHEVEVLYLLGRAHWARGLATEAATAIRDYGFNVLSRPRLISLIHHENGASRRMAEKAGFRYEREVAFMGHLLGLFSIESRRGDQQIRRAAASVPSDHIRDEVD